MFASFHVPGFRVVYLAGFLFSTARWGLGFLAAFVANDLTSSPRAVQLTGAALWLPLLLAGVVAGALADRFDRRRLLVGAIALLAPVVLILGLMELNGALRMWMIYPAMVVGGVSWVVDMTSRRTLVLDLVGPGLIGNAIALESFSTALGLALGVVAGGAVVQALGVGQAFVAVSMILVLAALFFLRLDPPAPGSTMPANGKPAGTLRSAISNRTLRSVLGVTVLANFFYFSHTPLVPVFAERLGADAFGAGLLASAGGMGMMVAGLSVARLRPPRGPTYVTGVAVGLVALNGLGLFQSFGYAFVSLLIGSMGFGLFGATQAAATMTSVEPGLQGRAMGLLSMAIGALPIGMFTLGELAERIGPRRAVNIYAVVGVCLLGLWLLRRPEVLRAR